MSSDSNATSATDAVAGDSTSAADEQDVKEQLPEDYCVNYQSVRKHVFACPANETRPSKYGRLVEAIAFDAVVSAVLFAAVIVWTSSDEDVVWLNYALAVVPVVGACVHLRYLISSPVASKIIFSFEFLFVFFNIVMWVSGQCAMFGWDERCVGVVALFFATFFVLLGDARNDHGLFYYRKYFFVLYAFLVGLILLFSFGRVFRDIHEYKTRCNLYALTCSDNVTHTIRNVSGERFKMEPVYSYDVFSDFRLALIVIYFIKWSVSSFDPRKCAILSTLTRRELVQDREVIERLLKSEEQKEEGVKVLKKKKSARLKITRTLSRAVNELDEESKRRVEAIVDDNAIIDVYFPGAGETIINGPQYTVLAWTLLGDFELAERINCFLERNVKWTQRLFLLGWPLAFLAMAEVLPYECVGIVFITLPDPLRVIWKLNAQACLLVMRHMNFWFPAFGCLVFTVGLIVSFNFDANACMFCPIFFICMISALLSDADVHRRILNKPAGVVMYMLCSMMLVIFIFLILLGIFPRVRNRVVDFTFWNNEVQLGSVSIATSFAAYPIIFIFKFVHSTLKDPRACRIISVPLYRISTPKSKLYNVLRALSDETNKLALLEKGRYDAPVALKCGRMGFGASSPKVVPSGDDSAAESGEG